MQNEQHNIIKKRLAASLLVIISDMIWTLCAWFLAAWFCHDLAIPPYITLQELFLLAPIVLFVQMLLAVSLGVYRSILRYASIFDLLQIIKAVICTAIVLSAVDLFFNIYINLPRAQLILFAMLSIILMGGFRLIIRTASSSKGQVGAVKKVLILGAGNAGERIARELLVNRDSYLPVGMLDDDLAKIGREIHGIRVLGRIDKLPDILQHYMVDLILIAIPAANAEQMRRIVDICDKTQVIYRTLPSINEVTSGRSHLSNIRSILLEDLLSRDPVHFDWEDSYNKFVGKVILVTGAGGSIGSELCRQLARFEPATLILLDHAEYNLYQIERELKTAFPKLVLIAALVNITFTDEVDHLFQKLKPAIIFHAAAYKHVPMLESQVRIAIRNNIIGTQVIVERAMAHQVEEFVLISTDKAVNPSSVMGASKRCAEMICQIAGNKHPSMQINTVRFGNVLDSSGSVIPLFRNQIENGGPVTVSHPDVERYFMTIPEAVQLILQAVTGGQASDVFVLDMGTAVKILDLAEQLIKLAGLKPYEQIPIVFTGLRPGEKLTEELFYQHEQRVEATHKKVFRVQLEMKNPNSIEQKLQKLMDLALLESTSEDILKTLLFEVVQSCASPTQEGV